MYNSLLLTCQCCLTRAHTHDEYHARVLLCAAGCAAAGHPGAAAESRLAGTSCALLTRSLPLSFTSLSRC